MIVVVVARVLGIVRGRGFWLGRARDWRSVALFGRGWVVRWLSCALLFAIRWTKTWNGCSVLDAWLSEAASKDNGRWLMAWVGEGELEKGERRGEGGL